MVPSSFHLLLRFLVDFVFLEELAIRVAVKVSRIVVDLFVDPFLVSSGLFESYARFVRVEGHASDFRFLHGVKKRNDVFVFPSLFHGDEEGGVGGPSALACDA